MFNRSKNYEIKKRRGFWKYFDRLHKKWALRDIQKLNIKQWASLKGKKSVERTINLEKVFSGKRIRTLSPWVCLPKQITGIKQLVWVQNRRKFLQSFTFQERNIVLIGDPFVVFDPFT
jgi:hypothetical protein